MSISRSTSRGLVGVGRAAALGYLQWRRKTTHLLPLTHGALQVTCTAVVSVTDAAGRALGAVTLAGTWTTPIATPGWPFAASGVMAGGTGRSAGTASILSSSTNKVSAARGNGCTFTVTSATLPGYALSMSTGGSSALSRSLSW